MKFGVYSVVDNAAESLDELSLDECALLVLYPDGTQDSAVAALFFHGESTLEDFSNEVLMAFEESYELHGETDLKIVAGTCLDIDWYTMLMIAARFEGIGLLKVVK